MGGSNPSPSTTSSIAPPWSSGKLTSLSKRKPRVRVPSAAPQPVRASAGRGGFHPPGAGAAPALATIAISINRTWRRGSARALEARGRWLETTRPDHNTSRGRAAAVRRSPKPPAGGSTPPDRATTDHNGCLAERQGARLETPRYPNSAEEAGSDPVNVLVRIQLGAPHPTQPEDDDVDTNDEFRF